MPIEPVRSIVDDGEIEISPQAQEDIATWGEAANLRVVGRAQPRVEGAEKVSSTLRNSDEVEWPHDLSGAR